ncbi:MAG: hypothetical protein CME63_16515 [Halobacteriovoraceae bacterium]|nr:hypothetical protein [Halobacteriovoraceae bacterium]|tara:strand:- start:5469 stop:6665 length:1197 start_codon:yes stop_codon:yes gene_type:complete
MNSNLYDLDEICLKIQNKNSRSYAKEAIKCYRAGANRASISTIWNALLFDLICKFREMGNNDHQEAKKTVQKYDTAISKQDLKSLLSIEREILNKCFEWELISNNELKRLNLIKDDRNLSSHPSLEYHDSMFKPSPEQTRAHLVHAITYVLANPPLVGKHALKNIDQFFKSTYTPNEKDKFQEIFRDQFLNNANTNLSKSLFDIFVKTILKIANQENSPKYIQRVQYSFEVITIDKKILCINKFKQSFIKYFEKAYQENLVHNFFHLIAMFNDLSSIIEDGYFSQIKESINIDSIIKLDLDTVEKCFFIEDVKAKVVEIISTSDLRVTHNLFSNSDNQYCEALLLKVKLESDQNIIDHLLTNYFTRHKDYISTNFKELVNELVDINSKAQTYSCLISN